MSRTTPKAKTEDKPFVIPPIETAMFKLRVIGDSPLICHRFSAKAKIQMGEKQQGKAKQAKAPKDPQEDFKASLYPLPGGKDGEYAFPGSAFKKAAVSACSFVDGISKVAARGGFYVIADMVKIEGPRPKMREDTVRIGKFGSKTTDLRYRGEFSKWSCEIMVRYNSRMLTPSQIINLFNTAGFSVGIGEWRPEKDGSFGMFHVEVAE
jgi:hypothetical protein